MSYDCCVFECESTRRSRQKHIKLYSFPCKPGEGIRRREWVKFVKNTRPDGDDWEPEEYSKVCSAHFIGGKKSTLKISPAFNPTLYPGVYTDPATLEETQINELLLADRKTIRKLNTKLRLEGKQYYGEKRTKGGVQLVIKEAREIGPPCTSPRCMQSKKSRFCHRFTEDDRRIIFNEFWSMTNLKDRKNYIRKLVIVGVPKRRTCKEANVKQLRTADYKYYLRRNGKKYQVCKDLFTSTFGMKNWKFYRWFKNEKNENDNDEEGKSEFSEEEEGSDMDENEGEIEIKDEPLQDPLAIDPSTSSDSPYYLNPNSNHSYDEQQPSTSSSYVNMMENQFDDSNNVNYSNNMQLSKRENVLTITESSTIVTENLPQIASTQSSKNPELNSGILATLLGSDYKRELSQLINTAVEAKLKKLKAQNILVEPEHVDLTETRDGAMDVEMLCDEYPEHVEGDADHANCSNMENFVQVQLQEMDEDEVSEINYKCIHCPNIFPTQNILNEHYITIKFCSICKTQYDDDLYQHILTTHIKDQNTCEFCSENIDNDIENHMKIHAFIIDNNSEITCDNCNMLINSDEHICQITKTCIPCNITYPSKQELLIHIISQHFKSDRCKICFRNISVIGLADLEMHVRYCKPLAKKFNEICLKCHKEFSNVHMLMEHHKKEHECLTHCSETFDRKNDLIDHLVDNVHKIPGLICKFCFIGFEERQLFITHVVKHKMKRNKYYK